MILPHQEKLPSIATLYIPLGEYGNQLAFDSGKEAMNCVTELLLAGHIIKLDRKSLGSELTIYTVRWGS